MRGKRQQTMAKIARERAVKERRELKKEKKQAAARRRAEAADGTLSTPVVDDEEPRPFDELTADSRPPPSPTSLHGGGNLPA